ncbi:hypothetical protein WR25_24811 [Diploscapter pachys]|uniref:Centromere/kinetochore protein zw10 homolog n=1 Tax=Diploscapter pachys TaxID=2018661 RepID=A0A2A2LVF2_9BILA|nr:hypothetical protein WR25_24811 [Diploscapter pachys]
MDDLDQLESDIKREMDLITRDLDRKYAQSIPSSVIDGDAQFWSIKKLENLASDVGKKLDEVERAIREIGSVEKKSREHSELVSRLTRLQEEREYMESLLQIESALVDANQIHLDNDDLGAVDLAKKLIQARDTVEQLGADDGSRFSLSSVRHLLSDAIADVIAYSVFMHKSFFSSFLSYPPVPTSMSGLKLMQILNENSDLTTMHLTALHILEGLSPRISKWATVILRDFCETIIDSCGREADHKVLTIDDNSSTTNHSYLFQCRASDAKSDKPMNIEAIFSNLENLFMYLSRALDNVYVESTYLIRLLGKEIEDRLFDMITKRLLVPTTAFETQSVDTALQNAISAAERFRLKMIEFNFFSEATKLFSKYADEHALLFIDRRCLSILGTAKQLIQKPYIEMCKVGSSGEVEEETVLEFSTVFSKQYPPNVAFSNDDSSFPKLFQLQKCTVSQSTVDLVNLVAETLKEAINATDEVLFGRLVTTASNIIQLYILLAPRHHKEALATVPQMTAIFYNNCYYLCHRLMLLTHDVLRDAKKADPAKYEAIRPLLANFIEPLRENAGNCMNAFLSQARRQLSLALSVQDMFDRLEDLEKADQCRKILKQCTAQIQSIAKVWKEVLTESVYCKALGTIVSYLLESINALFMSMEDIRTYDADVAALAVQTLVMEMDRLFEINGRTHIHSMCPREYFRTKEIIFCLQANLQAISDRWCDGKGPLAQYLTPNEVRHLVKALFQNSDYRKRLLETIC